MCPRRRAGSVGKAGLAGSTCSSPVIIRVLLPVTAFRGDGADNVLSVRTHQLHRMDSQMLVQVCTALSSIGAQVAFVFSFLWGRKNRKKKKNPTTLKIKIPKPCKRPFKSIKERRVQDYFQVGTKRTPWNCKFRKSYPAGHSCMNTVIDKRKSQGNGPSAFS